VKSSDEDMERLLLRYFMNDEWAARGSLSLDSIFEQVGRPSGWQNSYFDQLRTPLEKGALSAILERMAGDGLLEIISSEQDETPHYQASPSLLKHPRYDYLYPKFNNVELYGNGDLLPLGDADQQSIQSAIDSTNWTGLSTRISAEDSVIIRERAKVLLLAIMQSDADIQSRTDACKRVEAVIVLLEAPNVPWREVVGLLNHPSVTALFAALSLIQFLIGLSS
jgi:hypothetical protein